MERNFISLVTLIFRPESNAVVLNVGDIKIDKNKIFIMGSGYSINSISKEEWNHFKKEGNIISFNLFHKGRFVPVDFHIVGELGKRLALSQGLYNNHKLTECYREVVDNPCFDNAIFFLLHNMKPVQVNWALYYLNLFKDRKICFFELLLDDSIEGKIPALPSKDITKIPHCRASLFDAINISYILGYKEIVLVGVDLYDRRYFWLDEDETRDNDLRRGATYKDTHETYDVVIKGIKLWKEYLEKNDVKLYVYNPRSLLCSVLPLYNPKL